MMNSQFTFSPSHKLYILLIGMGAISYFYRILPVILIKFNILKPTKKSNHFADVVSSVLLGGIIVGPIFPQITQFSLANIFTHGFVLDLFLLGLAFLLTALTKSPNKVFFSLFFFAYTFLLDMTVLKKHIVIIYDRNSFLQDLNKDRFFITLIQNSLKLY